MKTVWTSLLIAGVVAGAVYLLKDNEAVKSALRQGKKKASKTVDEMKLMQPDREDMYALTDEP